MQKGLMAVLLTVSLAPVLGFFEKFFFNDWEYLQFLIILIAGDTVLGFYKHYKRGTISNKAWGQVLEKFITYGSVLIVIHILSHFTVDGQMVTGFHWIKSLGYSALIVKEAISILENLGGINNKLIPAWILKRLKDFDKTGKINDSNS